MPAEMLASSDREFAVIVMEASFNLEQAQGERRVLQERRTLFVPQLAV
jgi:hypothetical protein